MKILVIYAHPLSDSYCFCLFSAILEELNNKHDLVIHDLYKDNFSPVLTASERASYGKPNLLEQELEKYTSALKWAEAIVFVYPTWWYGMPAILKGYLDRIWLPGIAFGLTPSGVVTTDSLHKIVKFGVVTTYGAPWSLIHLFMGNPGQKMVQRGLKRLFAKNCKMFWCAKYNLDKSSYLSKVAFLNKVRKTIAQVF